MEHFVVSARKYRPQTFKDVVGQTAITNTLLNAIENNHLAQALLFTGPRGVGKTSCARILAKMINSDGNTSEDEDFAFNIFELDAACCTVSKHNPKLPIARSSGNDTGRNVQNPVTRSVDADPQTEHLNICYRWLLANGPRDCPASVSR